MGFEAVPVGFPWNRAAIGAPWSRPPLVAASVRNGLQTLACWTSPRFRRQIARHVRPLVESTTECLLVVAGSCGLELVSAGLRRTGVPVGLRIRIVALGPVARRPIGHPRVDVVVVRGPSDRWSRRGCPLATDHEVDVDHLGYAADPGVRQIVREEALRLAGVRRAPRGSPTGDGMGELAGRGALEGTASTPEGTVGR